ncbi:kinesin-related protein [Salix suchowensis]|nr:kinesin-related protein [Salix suchowensis]
MTFLVLPTISLELTKNTLSSARLYKPTPSLYHGQIYKKLASCLIKQTMNYESPWQEILLEASLALPVQLPPPGFEVYKARPGSSRSSNITETDKKGQEMEAAKDQVARKRMNDRTYRERCKAGAKDGDLQRENTQLKSNIALLRSQVNDRNNLDKLQLQEKNAQLEHEKRSLEMIVQALCEKISNEKGADEGDHAG